MCIQKLSWEIYGSHHQMCNSHLLQLLTFWVKYGEGILFCFMVKSIEPKLFFSPMTVVIVRFGTCFHSPPILQTVLKVNDVCDLFKWGDCVYHVLDWSVVPSNTPLWDSRHIYFAAISWCILFLWPAVIEYSGLPCDTSVKADLEHTWHVS